MIDDHLIAGDILSCVVLLLCSSCHLYHLHSPSPSFDFVSIILVLVVVSGETKERHG